MSKDNSNGLYNKGASIHEEEEESSKSFVKKVKSRVSGLIPSSLTKWFGSEGSKKAVVRLRDEVEDDDDEQFQQPPVKRAKLPNSSPVNTYRTSGMFLPPRPTQSLFIQDDNLPGPSSQSNDFYNDKDSESGESTSGYSSIVKVNAPRQEEKKDPYDITNVINENHLFSSPNFGHNRTLFTDKSISSHANTSLSSRRPSFNASTFGSPSFVDRTLSTQRIMSSPFYSGCTTYGGAAAHTKPKMPKVQVKPVNELDQNVIHSSTLSLTARRILNTLEQYATDVNKIPHPLSDKKTLSAKYSGANPYLVREHRVPNTELQVPTVPDLLKMKLKERLQDSTVAVRHIATTSKTAQDEYKTTKHTNKIKTKISSIRQKTEEEHVALPNLPEVSLPITTLPKFDLSFPLLSTNKPVTVAYNEQTKKLPEVVKLLEKPKIAHSNNIVEKPSSPQELLEFKFADPLVLAQNKKSIIAINDFKFSEPVIFNKVKSSDGFSLKLKNNATAAKLLEPSGDLSKFKPGNDTWECSVCLLRNLSDKVKCVACEAPKRTEVVNSKTSFGSEFKMSDDKWECTSCLVRNSNKDSVCVACSAPKQKLNGPINMFGGKFKPPSGTWECPTCMIRNKDELEKCAACETLKVGSTTVKPVKSLDVFKMKTDQWECGICMVRNSVDQAKCIACETSRPNTTQSENKTAPSFTFGIFSNAKTTASGFTFTSSESKSDGLSVNKTQQFIFGTKPPVTQSEIMPAPSFTFGLKPPTKTESEEKTLKISTDTKPNSDVTSKSSVTKSKFFSSSPTAFTPPDNSSKTTETLPLFKLTGDTEKSAPNTSSLFKFGGTNTGPLTFGATTTTPTKPFENPLPLGQASVSSAQTQPVNKTVFEVPEKQSVPVFENPVTQAKPVSTFNPTEFSTAPAFSFGASANPSGFSFGQKPVESEKPAAFSFGAKSDGGFSFTTQTGSSTSSFSFNTAKSGTSSFQANAQPTASIFQTEAPAQPVAPLQNGLFSFGTTPNKGSGPGFGTAPVKASGFSFGTPGQQFNAPTAISTPSVFSFGGGQPTSTPAGFNFGTPAPGPTFNADIKPTFNFTGGATPTFSAQSTGDNGTVVQRRKIRAVRRNPQR